MAFAYLERIFGGKRYENESGPTTKQKAQTLAKSLRNKGYLARVTKESNGFAVWSRRK